MPAQFVLQNGKVTLQPNPSLTIDGKPVTAPVVLHDDTEAKPTVVRTGTLSFVAIRREDAANGPRFGIRVRDTDADARTHFKGLDYFPVDPKCARRSALRAVQPAEENPDHERPRHDQQRDLAGRARLHAAGPASSASIRSSKQGETDYFIIFKDATSGKETYGAARYLYAKPPDANGKTIVDFNKAYNPPCAFTPYATCPLPPPQNRLPIRIEAGEKKYAGGHA